MAPRELPLLSRRQIEDLIAQGRAVFILDQQVIKADAWMPYHPGGDTAIRHMIGRDATDEVTVLHSPEARERMNKYRIGRIEGTWINFVPPIQGGTFRLSTQVDKAKAEVRTSTASSGSSSLDNSRESSPVFDDTPAPQIRQRRTSKTVPLSTSSATSVSSVEEDDGMTFLDTITKEKIDLDLSKYPALDTTTQTNIIAKYRQLNQRIKDDGLYNCNYLSYAPEVFRYTLLFSCMLFFLHRSWYATSGLFLGAFWHQLVFTAHDAGHMGITHNFHIDTVIGIFIADFCGGLSIGWWKRNHNVHHITTNHPEHDPDIQHMPMFAVSHRFLGSLKSTYYGFVMEYDAAARVLLRFQRYTYHFLLLFGRFNLYRLSWQFLASKHAPRKGPAWWHTYLEILGQVVFWTWFGYFLVYKTIPTNWDRFVFVMVSHMVTMPLHLQITLSHFAMSTADLGEHESFAQKMLRTTMDIDCPPWLDFFHGGLQFQAIHHLYPRIPRHNLRHTQKLVQEFCTEVGIPYALYGFVKGNTIVLDTLGEVSQQAAILAKCQKFLSESDDPLHAH
ncbi:fatty acid desaturase-domain-containing protein [Microdochium bolleyi]|uniref:Delta 8-(E)-sphingolipid desaturase n=1 Tax=Microdochium bolleyi TaxID=196109 RepID=A0A136J0G3_9PEZI|nr:fatty acid desaturase-domain-containing protein [Microdochium bolleyi]